MSTTSACVLAVDDNATIRRAIAMRLGAKGYQVVTAEDGPRALNALERQDFDLVLLDLQMPGMGGDEVLKTVRARYSESQLPVIMLSASDDKLDIARTLELGANDYIVKPGDLPILLARINTQLNLKQAAERLREASLPPRHAGDLAEEEANYSLRELLHQPSRLLYDHTPVTCLVLDTTGRILLANHHAATLLGYSREALVGQQAVNFYAESEQALFEEQLGAVLAQPDRLHHWEIRRRRPDNETFRVRETVKVLRQGDDTVLLLTCEDIDESSRLLEKINYYSSHDDLTGLANRKVLEERLCRVLESAQEEGSEHSLAIIDIDQFRVINDSGGHGAGDELLRQIARILRTVIRRRDTLARIGGDDFALLIEDCPLSVACAALEAARLAVQDFTFLWQERAYHVSLSIGLVTLTNACDSVASAISMADTACYAAKESGRNRLHIYQHDDIRIAARHGQMRWATRISDALQENRCELWLQTIAPVSHQPQGDHYEMLIRMRDERGKLVLPGEFLPAAERYNLSGKLDRWVIGKTFAWLRDNPRMRSRLHLCAINLSGQSFGNEELLAFILRRLEAFELPADRICFEVTETSAVSDVVQASRFMSALKDRGCLFALDDFGTGFSSYGYLKNLPVDFLKIDGTFVRGIVEDSVDMAMVRSINEIGHLLGKRTVAEFVENERVLQAIAELGVDYAQGYGIGRPMPLSAFEAACVDA